MQPHFYTNLTSFYTFDYLRWQIFLPAFLVCGCNKREATSKHIWLNMFGAFKVLLYWSYFTNDISSNEQLVRFRCIFKRYTIVYHSLFYCQSSSIKSSLQHGLNHRRSRSKTIHTSICRWIFHQFNNSFLLIYQFFSVNLSIFLFEWISNCEHFSFQDQQNCTDYLKSIENITWVKFPSLFHGLKPSEKNTRELSKHSLSV